MSGLRYKGCSGIAKTINGRGGWRDKGGSVLVGNCVITYRDCLDTVLNAQ